MDFCGWTSFVSLSKYVNQQVCKLNSISCASDFSKDDSKFNLSFWARILDQNESEYIRKYQNTSKWIQTNMLRTQSGFEMDLKGTLKEKKTF